MMKKRVKLNDIWDLASFMSDYQTANPSYVWPSITYVDEDNVTHNVTDPGRMWDYLGHHYMTFCFYDTIKIMSVKHDIPYTDEASFLSFAGEWSNFIAMHPEYARLAEMMARADYDPLENYDRKENGGWKDTTDDDSTHKMEYAKQTTTTTNDPKIKTKTTGSVWADNTTVSVPDTESITEPVRDNASDVDTIKTENDAHTDKSSVEGDLTVTRLFQNYRIHGNIGVTTAAQMIKGELDVRTRNNIEAMIYDTFARQCLTTMKEVSV